jgi:thiosulfate/3-mercaptopyruvate sulfurtransferase
LHGGFRAWKAEGLPVEIDAKQRPVVSFPIQETPGHILSVDDVCNAMGDSETVLVDCRDYAEWLGANSSPYGYDYCPRKGRIPGAKWLEWYRLLERVGGVSRLRPADEIRAMCAEIGITPEKRVIVYCFKGARASVVVMALRRAGFSQVSNYFASWNEWSRDFSLPVDDRYPED